jgi:hypothetical protein
MAKAKRKSNKLVRLRRLVEMKPYEVGSVTKGANKRSFCVIKEDTSMDLKAVAQAIEGLPKLLTVLKAENIDASAQGKIETEIRAAITSLLEAAGQPKNEGNFDMNELAKGLNGVAEDLQAAGVELDLVDRVAALGEKAATLIVSPPADTQAAASSSKDEAAASTENTAAGDQEASASSAGGEASTEQVAASASASDSSADESSDASASTGDEDTAAGDAAASETITKADLSQMLNAFGKTLTETVMKTVNAQLEETKKVVAQKSAMTTTVPGSSNPSVNPKSAGSPKENIFDTFDMSAAASKLKTKVPGL